MLRWHGWWLKATSIVLWQLLVADQSVAAPDDVSAAQTTASQFGGIAGDADAIENNLTQGVLSGSSMTTVDGSTFTANIGCLSDDNFLEVFIAPTSTGDIGTVRLQQDTTKDGRYDRLFDVPFNVSGVCANGLISCDAGTWNNCSHHRWAVDPATSAVGISPAGVTEVGNCYCVNNSCGSGLVASNASTIVSDIAGGITAVLGNNDPYYIISNSFIDGPFGRFSGQQIENCSSDPLSLINSSEYFAYPQSINSDSQAATATNDTYLLIANSPVTTNSEALSAESSCRVDRSIAVNAINPSDIILQTGGTGGVSLCGPDCIRLVLGRIGNNYWRGSCRSYPMWVEFAVLRPDLIDRATLVRAVFDDWIQVYANDDYIWSGPYNNFFNRTGGPPGRCELSTSWSQNPNADFTASLRNNSQVRFDTRTVVAGRGEGYILANVMLNTSCLPGNDIMNDTCTALQTNPECTLYHETVDGVATIVAGAATGISPLPSTRSFTNGVCTVSEERPFWEVERTYRCTGTVPEYDFSDALERSEHVTTNATATNYSDRVLNASNQPVITTGGMTIIDEVPYTTCESACKVRELVPANDVTLFGNESNDLNPDNAKYEFRYKLCANSASSESSTTCPLVGAEEIVKDCGCINEFAESSVILQSMRMAGHDAICSSGVPQ